MRIIDPYRFGGPPVAMGSAITQPIFDSPFDVTLPSGVVPGELILVVVLGAAGSGGTPMTAAGYTYIGQGYAGGGIPALTIFGRTATGADACIVDTAYGGGMQWSVAVAWRISGGATPAEVSVSFDEIGDGTLNCLPPAISSQPKGFLAIVTGQMSNGTTAISNYPAGYSNGQLTTAHISAPTHVIAAAEKTCSAGPETPAAIVMSNGYWYVSGSIVVLTP